MIASDIKLLENRTFSESSQKEKLFFLFLTSGNISSVSLGESPSDKLCHDAFVLGLTDSEVLKKLQRSKPLKNIHYSKNLIDLVAAAKIDFKNEESHIEEYLSDHGLREAYLIHLALGVDIPKNVKIRTDFDRLIEALVIKESYEKSVELFSKLLLTSTHIFDVIILRELYKIHLMIHPESRKVEEFESLKVISKKVSHAFNGVVMLILTMLVAYGAVEYLNWYMENKKQHDELKKIAIQIFSVILIVAMFLGLNIPDKVRLLDLIRNKILTLIYSLFGLNYADVEKVLNDESSSS